MNKQTEMKKFPLLTMLCVLLLTACSRDEWQDMQSPASQGGVFSLCEVGYEGETSGSRVSAGYDRLEFCIVDVDGCRVLDAKGRYDTTSCEIRVEGLHEGDYRLLVLAVRGNAAADGAEINTPMQIGDTWLSFPTDLRRPLSAEYYYAQKPFSVSIEDGREVTDVEGKVELRRLVSRLDFSFDYRNPNVRWAVTRQRVSLSDTRFCTTVSADGIPGGTDTGGTLELELAEGTSLCFLPTAEGSSLAGEVELFTRDWRGTQTRQTYSFGLEHTEANHIHKVETQVEHPEDRSALMFVSRAAYLNGNHKLILQDDEPKEVYTDSQQRQFDTAQPLQLELTDDGQLHARFYSPRGLGRVLVKARIPAVSDEYFELAYFDTIPGFADFYETMPLMERSAVCSTESGRLVEAGPLEPTDLADADFRVETTDPYWARLQGIEHGWTIRWGLYGGDPEREDGGPVGNWMGIRPVHCRESVALFLNFTYMVDMPEHEQILRENADKLYDDQKNPIRVEQVLAQMRQRRTLQVGLVYPGNGVVGLGGGSTFGAYQQAWFEHYWNAYSCSIMFHELGHVMGYGHSSSFTYGPWAEELMNNFYVQNIGNLPIDSPEYLNSKNNPNRYQ